MHKCECGCELYCNNRFVIGHHRKGIKLSDKTKEHISSGMIQSFSVRESKGQYSRQFNVILKNQIKERDNYTCQICLKIKSKEKLCIHHIDYNKKNHSNSNLITLCRQCHSKTNGKRIYWVLYFAKKKNLF
jgi:5-methylcytosine-specific restriction endonuclease McrA